MSCGDSRSRGVAVLFRPNLDCDITTLKNDTEGRITTATINIDDTTLHLCNIYAPRTDSDRTDFFPTIHDYLSPTHGNIVGGDFNCISNNKLDKQGGNPQPRQSAITALNTLQTSHNLTDIWRNQHPTTRAFTWAGKNPTDNSAILTRIDKIFISHAITHNAAKTTIKPYPHSDHDLITLTLDLSRMQRGKGYWHFNNTLLNNAAFNADIISFWNNWITQTANSDNRLTWWDKAKYHFKQIAIHHAKTLRKIQNKQRTELEQQLQRLQQKVSTGNNNDIEQYLLAKQRLHQFELDDLEAIKIRTKARFSEEGEKSTKYFYNLEKSRQADQTIKILTKDNLDTVTDPYDILTEARDFYKTLYTAEPIDETAQRDIMNIPTPRLKAQQQKSCEGFVRCAELTASVKAMTPNRSPGIDGLTVNFYQHFVFPVVWS